MDSGVWLVAIAILVAALPLVYWGRTRKRIAIILSAALILIVVVASWVLLNSGDCTPPEKNPRYKDPLPGDCFKSPF